MAHRSPITDAILKAHGNIHKGHELARERLAKVPIGQEMVDPRTHKKRQEEGQMEPGMDSQLNRILYELRSQNAAQEPNELPG